MEHTPARTLRRAPSYPSRHSCPSSLLAIPVRTSPSPALRPRFSCVPVPGFPPCLRPRQPSHLCSPVRVPVCALLEGPAAAALALPAGPAEAACALCQRAPREPVRADCGHRFCRACVVRFWAEEDGPFPCPECADDCWQRAVEPGRPPLSRRLLALEEAAAAPARDGPASEAALQLLCRADGGPLCAACRMAAGPEPPEWEPRWRKALRGKVRAGGVPCAALPRRVPCPPSHPQTAPCPPSVLSGWRPGPQSPSFGRCSDHPPPHTPVVALSLLLPLYGAQNPFSHPWTVLCSPIPYPQKLLPLHSSTFGRYPVPLSPSLDSALSPHRPPLSPRLPLPPSQCCTGLPHPAGADSPAVGPAPMPCPFCVTALPLA